MAAHEDGRTEALQLRLTAQEKEALKRAARLSGQSLSEWARDVLDRGATASGAIGELVHRNDPELADAIRALVAYYAISDTSALVRLALVTLHRQLMAGHDPFTLAAGDRSPYPRARELEDDEAETEADARRVDNAD